MHLRTTCAILFLAATRLPGQEAVVPAAARCERVSAALESDTRPPDPAAEARACRQAAAQAPATARPALLTHAAYLYEAADLADSARAAFRRAAEAAFAVHDTADAARLLFETGVREAAAGHTQAARGTYRRVTELPPFPDPDSYRASAWAGLAQLAHLTGQPDSGLAPAREGLRSVAPGDSATGSELHQLIGALFQELNQADSASAHYARALELLPPGDPATASLFANRALLERDLGRPAEARALARSADSLAALDADTLTRIAALNTLGLGLLDDSLRADAARALQAALQLAEAAQERRWRSRLLNHLGIIQRYDGALDSALALLQAALRLDRSDPIRTGYTLVNVGLVQRDRGMLPAADSAFRRAARLAGARDDRLAWWAHQQRGELWLHDIDPAGATTAVREFALAGASRRRLSTRSGGDENRLAFDEQVTSRELYDHWLSAWLHSTAPGRVPAALAVAEEGRAQALLDLVGKHALRGGGPTDDPARLLADATPGDAGLLIYAFAGDSLVLWFHERGRPLEMHLAAVAGDQLGRLVARYRARLGVDSARGMDPESRRGVGVAAAGSGEGAPDLALAKLLLPDTITTRVARLRELVILPAGVLNLVPFAALPASGSGEPLGALVPVRYSPSIAVLASIERAPPGAGPGARQALVVGDPTMPKVVAGPGQTPLQLEPLPGARAEAAGVARLLGVAALTGPGATESAVRHLMPGAKIIHLATHGLAYSSERRARDSFVALAPDSINDGLLTVGELLEDPAGALTAELVALSACQSGLGNLRLSEGTVGLQRALLARGARTALVSLWSVSDDATALLMEEFYRAWLEPGSGRTKAEALRLAQAAVRTRSEFRDPRYWAAFQLVGGR